MSNQARPAGRDWEEKGFHFFLFFTITSNGSLKNPNSITITPGQNVNSGVNFNVLRYWVNPKYDNSYAASAEVDIAILQVRKTVASFLVVHKSFRIRLYQSFGFDCNVKLRFVLLCDAHFCVCLFFLS